MKNLKKLASAMLCMAAVCSISVASAQAPSGKLVKKAKMSIYEMPGDAKPATGTADQLLDGKHPELGREVLFGNGSNNKTITIDLGKAYKVSGITWYPTYDKEGMKINASANLKKFSVFGTNSADPAKDKNLNALNKNGAPILKSYSTLLSGALIEPKDDKEAVANGVFFKIDSKEAVRYIRIRMEGNQNGKNKAFFASEVDVYYGK